MPHPERRILFALAEPGYFRMYGSTITELTRRGWTVHIAFEKPDRRGLSPAVPPSAGGAVRVIGRAPHHASAVAISLRTGIDYVRYLEPAFADATYLRHRIERYLPRGLRFLKSVRSLPKPVVSLLISATRGIEHLIPPSREAIEFVARVQPDILFVTPLVAVGAIGVNQTELVKAARVLRIPVAVGAASWDHLTSKGLVRMMPDALLVWNDTQHDEAVRLQRVPSSRISITGAQPLDHWFEPISENAACEFRSELGIEEGRRVLLVVGSSPKMAPSDSEVLFVHRWLSAIRASNHPEVRDAFVIVRPHPGNTAPWLNVQLPDSAAVIHPRTYPNFPLTDADIELFRRSLCASAAVIGINTTAMIEAAILRRPVLTVRDPAFAHCQRQTLHFSYLEEDNGGFAIGADSLLEHVAQLERVVTCGADLTAADRFVRRFVRPLGMQQPATMNVCDTIERLVTLEPRGSHQRVCAGPVSESTR
jgi:hypothetical protein